ncbi:hypothetical protein CLOBE_55220 [Clostridium beijerinckii]|nr:hypothetical protein CLOBE_55220 [Clostridium beijerinckii]
MVAAVVISLTVMESKPFLVTSEIKALIIRSWVLFTLGLFIFTDILLPHLKEFYLNSYCRFSFM